MGQRESANKVWETKMTIKGVWDTAGRDQGCCGATSPFGCIGRLRRQSRHQRASVAFRLGISDDRKTRS